MSAMNEQPSSSTSAAKEDHPSTPTTAHTPSTSNPFLPSSAPPPPPPPPVPQMPPPPPPLARSLPSSYSTTTSQLQSQYATQSPFGSTTDLTSTPHHLPMDVHPYPTLSSPYSSKNSRRMSIGSSLNEKYSVLNQSPLLALNYGNGKEDDDWLHDPDPDSWAANKSKLKHGGTMGYWRGMRNIGCLVLLAIIILGAFLGWPVATAYTSKQLSTFGAYNIGGLNASGQVPEITGNYGLIDKDTPQDAYTKVSPRSQKKMSLVFSDEFNEDGRSFYPGDDPYWEAVDLHYWQTNNLEWYDPAGISTANGALEITLSQAPNAAENHQLNYMGGMMSTWNKFCFTGGYVETSVTLPGYSNVNGLWPAIWMMGNLGRAGFGASLDGMWPYTYDSCDVGTLKNQSLNGYPTAATTEGDAKYDNSLSYLSGQRLSACTCGSQDDEHPGPKRGSGYVGRAAPEIDFFEAQVTNGMGVVSQSAQVAPFDNHYEWRNETGAIIVDSSISKLNGFKGNVYQEATSVVTVTDQNCYQHGTGCMTTYGVEYQPGFDDAYISWISDGKLAWTLLGSGIDANEHVGIGARPIPQEPMYLIMNLGISENFGTIEFDKLTFPAVMRVDWIRVYQEEDQMNIGCNPDDFPTAEYIETFKEAYTNPNLTTWSEPLEKGGYAHSFPKNSLIDNC